VPTDDFDLNALYQALDAQRQSRGLTWAQATREISRVGPAIRRHPIASSTITGLRTKGLAEADGVLQMLRWMGRAPESFMPGLPEPLAASSLPAAETRQVLRFDTKKLHESLDDRRRARGLSWPELEAETTVPASHMRGLKKGGRTAFPAVMRLTRWLRQPAAHFIRLSPY
jgi:phytoene dehydrogenase-like protein